MGSGGSKTTSTGNQLQQSSLTPNAAMSPILGYMGAQGQSLADQPVGFFPGQTYVGPSGLTQQAVGGMANAGQGMQQGGNMMQAAAMGGYGALPGMMGLNNQAMGNYGMLSNAADVANNPYAQNILAQNQRTAQQSLQNMMPSVNQGAQSVNAMGSSRHGLMQGKAIGDVTNSLLNTNANMMGSMYGQGLGAQQNALAQTGAMQQNLQAPTNWGAQLGQMYGQGAQMQNQGAGVLGGAGQMVEGYQQKALDDAMQRYAFQYQEPWQRMQNLQQLTNAFQPYGLQSGTGQSQQTGQASNGNQNLQTAASVVGTGLMVAGMMSDRRLKRNIKQIGKTKAGYNIYSWDYVWGAPGVGVMADEVPAEWRIKHQSGYDMVDYGKVG